MSRLHQKWFRSLLYASLLMASGIGAAAAQSYGGLPELEVQEAVTSFPGTDVYYRTSGGASSEAAPRSSPADYPRYRNLNSRLAIWVVTQQHTYFGGFLLALPIFCLIIEVMGLMARDPVAAARYDRLARDFLRISLLAFSISSILGVTLVLSLSLSTRRSFAISQGSLRR